MNQRNDALQFAFSKSFVSTGLKVLQPDTRRPVKH